MLNFIRLLFVFSITIFSLLGCMKVQDKDEDNHADNHADSIVHTDQVLTEDKFHIIAGSEPNHYSIELLEVPFAARIEKSLKGQTETLNSAACDFSVRHCIDSNVVAGERYQYKIFESKSQQIQRQIEVQIPTDLVVDKNFENTSNQSIKILEYGRVFFRGKIEYLVNGGLLEISTQQIIAEDLTLATFRAQQQAAIGMNGRSGGSIIIHADKIIGKIRFDLRGEQGGDGKNINVTFPQALAGADGQMNIKMFSSEEAQIIKLPENGSDGQDGANGGDAGGGGNSGSLTLYNQDDSQANITIEIEPGLAGKPGKGGRGQKGGFRGQWSAGSLRLDNGNQIASRLGVVNQAKDGSDGKDGMDGKPGRIGSKRSACVYRGETLSFCK